MLSYEEKPLKKHNKYLCFLFYFKEAEAEIHGQFQKQQPLQIKELLKTDEETKKI